MTISRELAKAHEGFASDGLVRRSQLGALAWLLSRLFLCYALLQLVVRLGLIPSLVAKQSAETTEVVLAIPMGMLNDMLVAFYLLLPMALILAVSAGSTQIRRALVQLWITLLIVVTLISAIGDVFFWFEFESRPDRLVFHYLKYPVEVAAFLQEQFYLSIVIFPFILVCWFCYRLLKGLVGKLHTIGLSRFDRGLLLVTCISGLLLAPWVFSTGPLQPSHSRHINALVSNTYFSVFHAAAINVDKWHLPAMDVREADKLIESVYLQAGNHLHERNYLPKGNGAANKGISNVILIIEESFAGETWQIPARRKQFMPSLSHWAGEGIDFENIYSTGSRTTRGMESLFHGVPPLPGISLTQRQGYQRLPSLPRVFNEAGFETTFLYGGWPNFSNFSEYWTNIGFENVISKYDFENRWFETSWGVADEILFEKLLGFMDERVENGRPVFVTTLTVSNHRPFDFPQGRISFPADERKLEYAIAYADWALGDFLAKAKAKSWYKNTLIIIVADHGPKPTGNATIPVSSFRIPLLFLGAGIEPQLLSNIGSIMDVPGTLTKMLGLPDGGRFWGNDLMSGVEGVALMEHDYHLGLLTEGKLHVLKHNGDVESWRPGSDGKYSQGTVDPEKINLARAIFQVAHQQFYSID